MRGEIQILESDYVAFQRLYFRRHLPRLALVVGLLIVGVGAFWLTGNLRGVTAVAATGTAVITALMIWGLLHFVTIPLRVRKLFRESAAVRERMAITCDKEAIHFAQESGTWRLKWAQAARWDETDAVFALFPNRAMAHLLPKRDVAPELIDYIRERLIASGLAQPWKLRK